MTKQDKREMLSMLVRFVKKQVDNRELVGSMIFEDEKTNPNEFSLEQALDTLGS